MKFKNPRMVGKSGREWVARGVVNGVKIPGYNAVDPLSLPLWERPSVRRNLARMGYASDERPAFVYGRNVLIFDADSGADIWVDRDGVRWCADVDVEAGASAYAVKAYEVEAGYESHESRGLALAAANRYISEQEEPQWTEW